MNLYPGGTFAEEGDMGGYGDALKKLKNLLHIPPVLLSSLHAPHIPVSLCCLVF